MHLLFCFILIYVVHNITQIPIHLLIVVDIPAHLAHTQRIHNGGGGCLRIVGDDRADRPIAGGHERRRVRAGP